MASLFNGRRPSVECSHTRQKIRAQDQLSMAEQQEPLATLCLAAGDNLKVVQELLGHSSAAFTLQVYGHVVPGLQEQSTRALEARLLGSGEVHGVRPNGDEDDG